MTVKILGVEWSRGRAQHCPLMEAHAWRGLVGPLEWSVHLPRRARAGARPGFKVGRTSAAVSQARLAGKRGCVASLLGDYAWGRGSPCEVAEVGGESCARR